MPTVRVTPPRNKVSAPRKGGKARAKTGPQELNSWLFRYRHQLWPYWTMLVLFFSTMIVSVPGVLAAALAATAVGVFYLGHHVRLDRQKERAYAAALLVAAGAWSVWALLADGWKPFVALPFITTLVSIPWFRHRTGKATIPITISPELRGAAKHRAEKRAHQITNGWAVITRQGRIQFADLDGLEIDAHTLAVDIVLRGGQSVRSLGYPTLRAGLESAFNAPADSLRIIPRGLKSSREVRLLFILDDRNATPLGAAPDDITHLGFFEVGGTVEFDHKPHTVVAGASGSGKSGIVNQIIRIKVRMREWAVVGIDLKPGGLELGPWEHALAYLADDPVKALRCLQGLLAGLTRRGEIMKERGWREWHATPTEPNICLVVDEVQMLRRIKGAMAVLEDLAALSRAYGFQLVLATQFPKDSNLPSTIMAQVKQKFCCKLEAPKDDRVVFGEQATAEGWTPSAIPDGMPGVYYVRSSKYTRPCRARGWWLTVDAVREEAAAQHRTLIDAVTGRSWLSATAGTMRDAMESGDMDAIVELEDSDVVDAVLVPDEDTEPLEVVLEAIRDGFGTREDLVEATGIPTSTMTKLLQELESSGRITKAGKRATRSKPWTVVE